MIQSNFEIFISIQFTPYVLDDNEYMSTKEKKHGEKRYVSNFILIYFNSNFYCIHF